MVQTIKYIGVVLLFGVAVSCKTAQPTTQKSGNPDSSGEPGPEKKETVSNESVSKREMPPGTTDQNQKGCVQGDCENGVGMFVYPTGDRYSGAFKDGVREGQGVMEYSNGDRYEGGYAHDQRQGQGTYTFKNKGVFVGQFHQGAREGAGTYRFSDSGEMFLGEIKDDGNSGEGSLKKGDQEFRCSLKGREVLCQTAAEKPSGQEP
jgi:hypothetical protein